MTPRRFTHRSLALIACAMLLACGGEDGPPTGSTGGGVTPAPTPTPSTTPVPTPLGIFGALGATNSQSFALLGFTIFGRDNGWGFDFDNTTIDMSVPVELRFAAPADLYFKLNGLESLLQANGGAGYDLSGPVNSLSYDIANGGVYLSLSKVGSAYLGDTGRAFSSTTGGSPAYPVVLGYFAYGRPTDPVGMPASGTVSFESEFVGGTEFSEFTVDFGSKTVTGTLRHYQSTGPSAYDLIDVEFIGDGTQFAGKLASAGIEQGTIEGRFTGPGASEMMVRYTVSESEIATPQAGVLTARSVAESNAPD